MPRWSFYGERMKRVQCNFFKIVFCCYLKIVALKTSVGVKKKLEKIIQNVVIELFALEQVDFAVDYPKDEKFGDYATNVAMVLAKKVGKNPMEIAEIIVARLNLENGKDGAKVEPLSCSFAKIEVVAPGYINFYLSEKFLQDVVVEIQDKKEKFGTQENKAVTINNEFISANPTGPLHLGNGRGGFCGDSLSKVLRKAGFEVVNEYYVNDAGEQVVKLGHSVLRDDEAVYTGDYIDNLNNDLPVIAGTAEKLVKKLGLDFEDRKVYLNYIGFVAAQIVLEKIIKTTISDKMKISRMNYKSEKELYSPDEENSAVGRAIKILKEKNLTEDREGALWLKTTEFGDDKDRVLIKSDGQKTYFASDCGYILNKIERGFDRIIETWGADHHGYINRFRAAAKALGFEGELKFIIVQLVRLVKDGKEVRMSKRAGNVVYVDDLIEKVGHDVTRFFFLMYSPDTHMNFDLGLAEERSQKNPVFYVQYAHARICSVLRKAEEQLGDSVSLDQNDQKTLSLERLVHEKELSLIRELNKFPELITELSESYEVHKLPYYAIKLADKFHSFYNACKVIDEENLELTKARLSLITAVRIVLAETLDLIGVSAPEKM